MYRSLKTGNKVVFSKQTERSQSSHLERLNMIKKSPSQTYLLQKKNDEVIGAVRRIKSINKKKEVMNQMSNDRLERENHILLKKMTDLIVKQGKKEEPQSSTLPTLLETEPRPLKRTNSLNSVQRKKEKQRLSTENQEYFHRIQTQPSVYSVKKWEREYTTREGYLKNMCEYPVLNELLTSKERSPLRNVFTPMSSTLNKNRSIFETYTPIRRNTQTDLEPRVKTPNKVIHIPTRGVTLFKKLALIEKEPYFINFSISECKLKIHLFHPKRQEDKFIILDEDAG